MSTDNSTPLGIIWHPTAEAVFYAMWESAFIAEGIPPSEIADTTVIGVNSETGDEEAMTVDEVVKSMEQQGMWGFVDTESRMIHAWADPGAAPGDVLHMLAHEVGHVTGEPKEDALDEEDRAEEFGQVAAEAFRLLCTRPAPCPVAA